MSLYLFGKGCTMYIVRHSKSFMRKVIILTRNFFLSSLCLRRERVIFLLSALVDADNADDADNANDADDANDP